MPAREVRKTCLRKGHRFREVAGVPLPYVFCARWFCGASKVSDWVWAQNSATAQMLHNAIPPANRWPPDTLEP